MAESPPPDRLPSLAGVGILYFVASALLSLATPHPVSAVLPAGLLALFVVAVLVARRAAYWGRVPQLVALSAFLLLLGGTNLFTVGLRLAAGNLRGAVLPLAFVAGALLSVVFTARSRPVAPSDPQAPPQ